jgi:hypothetical protein
LTGDPLRAEALAEQARARSDDEAEQQRIVSELAGAAMAQRRIEAWKAAQPKARLGRVLVAFAVGALVGGVLGLVRLVPAAAVLVPNGPPRDGEYFVFALNARSMVHVHTAHPALPFVDGAPIDRAVLSAGSHRLSFQEPASGVWLEVLPVP